MKVKNFRLHPFVLPLNRPFLVCGKEQILTREGVIVELLTDEGVSGFGEAAPLPGASQENLKKAVHQLGKLKDEFIARAVPPTSEALLDWLSSSMEGDIVCASARFALESAFLDLAARAKGVPVCEFLKPASTRALSVAGLLQGSLQEVTDRASYLASHGYHVFKLKVGNRNISLDIQKVEAVKSRIGLEGRLRLDANNGWRYDEAVLFAQNIGKNQIDYIEEPCAPSEKWEEFHRRTDIPVAVDESMLQKGFDDLNLIEGVNCFVLRPSVGGAITGTLALMRRAKEEGRRVVISSAFESRIGLTMLANLAILSGEAGGLGSEDWFQADLLTERLVGSGGIIPVPRLTLDQRTIVKNLFTDKVSS